MAQITKEELALLQLKRFELAQTQTALKEAQASLERAIQKLIKKYELIGQEEQFNIVTGEFKRRDECQNLQVKT